MDHVKKINYWKGAKNKSIRMYWYAKRGLDLFNDLRYIIMVIVGIYFALKLTNPLWMLLMFGFCIPLLILVGWFAIHHMAKVMDWLGIEFATYWSRYQFELQERQVKALEQINEKMDRSLLFKLNEKNK